MASDPLAELHSSIKRAMVLPDPVAHAPAAQPLAAIKRLIESEPKESKIAQGPEPQSPVDIDAGEIVELLARVPLQGPARLRAIKAGLHAKRNPSAENVQAILDILLGG